MLVILAALKFKLALAVALVCALFCTTAFAQQKGTFTDQRDGKTYKTTKIGKQVWMAENLNYNASESKCYDNYPSNCNSYGRLYNWQTAMKACPGGWHLPSKAEWEVLMSVLSGEKADKFGFFAVPSGYGYSSGYFYDMGNLSYWWSTNEYSSYNASSRFIYYNNDSTNDDSYIKNLLRSVRCIQD